MEPQTESTASRLDTPLLAVAVLLLAGGLFAFYYFDRRLGQLPRLGILFACVAGGIACGYHTQLGRLAWSYLLGARVEMRKVVWPTRQESVQVTLFVAGVVLLTALFLWFVDWVLLFGVHHLSGGMA
ncbi:MAG: preprotein translocase subunit SecE [Gammaproteobacteria bacterium]|nr:preprotein translocase subunit SecE [Gammaproteobacteria bacterium]